jgi:ribonuclease J
MNQETNNKSSVGNNTNRQNGQNRFAPNNNRRTMPKGKPSFNQKTESPRVINAPLAPGVLRILPLGGLGRIGKHMMCIEYGSDIIIVDAGFQFSELSKEPGVDYMIADTTYLEQKRQNIKGILITHAHEDHVGGLPYILPKFSVPVYGGQYSIKHIERKLEEFSNVKADLRVVNLDNHEKLFLGVFEVEFIRTTHSIPDSCMIAIKTPKGTILHTGDWLFEDKPVIGDPTDKDRIKAIGNEGIMMLMSDSTNCESVGHSSSEVDISPGLEDVFARCRDKRIIVSSFASQVSRMQIIIDTAVKFNRKVVCVGRSMMGHAEMAIKLGYLKVPKGTFVRLNDSLNMDKSQIVIMATGSQGETNARIARMANGEDKFIKLSSKDAVIFAASIIPGNDKGIMSTIDLIMKEGASVYHDIWTKFDHINGRLHRTGHAYVDEIVELLDMTKPKYFMPIHGEYHHLLHNGEIAQRWGMSEDNIFVVENGQIIDVDSSGPKKTKKIPAPSVYVENAVIGTSNDVVVKDRLAMGQQGVFTISMTISKKSGKLLSNPDILSRGMIYMKNNEGLIVNIKQMIKNYMSKNNSTDPSIIRANIRDMVSRQIRRDLNKTPVILISIALV